MITSRREAYLFLISWLSKQTEMVEECKFLIDRLMVAFSNHEQALKVVFQDIRNFLKPKPISDLTWKLEELLTQLETISFDISNDSTYAKRFTELFKNPVGRYYESCIGTEMLLSPTPAMMLAVNRVSIEIIKLLRSLETSHLIYIDAFLKRLANQEEPINMGMFVQRPSLEEVYALLETNDSVMLPQIMFVQYIFAQYVMRNVPLTTVPQREPVGKFREILQQKLRTESVIDYFTQQITLPEGPEGYQARDFISGIIYESPLFKAEGNRGRFRKLDLKMKTHQLGLMLLSQNAELYFPKRLEEWVADCLAQMADPKSHYVKSLICYDALYVAGPSGMTSLLLALMEMVGNFETVVEKQRYLAAIVAYIVGGGYHSLHEVIGPAQFCLDLLPGYKVSVPQFSYDPTPEPQPPNYDLFLKLLKSIDPDFEVIINTIKSKLITIYDREFTPGIELEKLLLAKELHDLINTAYLNYNTAYNEKVGFTLLHSYGEKDSYCEVLKNLCMAPTSFNKLLMIFQKYLNVQLTNESGEIFPGIVQEGDCSFISFLLNELKTKPQLIEELNRHLQGNVLGISAEIDYTDPQFSNQRIACLSQLKALQESVTQDKPPVLESMPRRRA